MNLEADRETGRWPPRRCDMPDLQGLSGQRAFDLIDHSILVKGGCLKSPQALAFVASFARLLDKTSREYRYAHAALLASADIRQTIRAGSSPTLHDKSILAGDIQSANNLLFQAGDHVENCITALRRTIVFARHIRRDQRSPQIPRGLPVLSDGMVNRIDTIRNAIEHIDERIARGEMVDGATITVTVKSDSIELGGEEIYFTELADWIRQLDFLVEKLSSPSEVESP